MIALPLMTDISFHNITSITAKSNLSQNGIACWLELTIQDRSGHEVHLTLYLQNGEHLRAGRLAQEINRVIAETKPDLTGME
jgi:hypothetical protein